MARYWIYLNDTVAGPYGLEQLIKVRGFSRQTLVSVDDYSGKPTSWISPAEIPELAHIFKAVDEHMAIPSPTVKLPVKRALPPPARVPRPYTPAVTLRRAERSPLAIWLWIFAAALVAAGGYFVWSQYAGRGDLARGQASAKRLVETARLPSNSLYPTLQQYLQEKNINPQWAVEKKDDDVYSLTGTWYAPALAVYAFEANTQAQTVRGLNSAASRLLSEGFPPPEPVKQKTAPAPKKTPADQFAEASESRRQAIESGDFQTVWDFFSKRKQAEMSRAGMSQEGFIRLQNLTHRVELPLQQALLKSKQDSDTEMLILLKQTQANTPELFLKQLWIFEGGAWKLDDEQKRNAGSSTPVAAPSADSSIPGPAAAQSSSSSSATSSDASLNTPWNVKSGATKLPGMSN